MAIADIAEAARENPRGGSPRCCVCNALDDLPPTESAGLLELLSNPTKRYSELQEDLANDPDNPLDLSQDALRKHARGRCSARTVLRKPVRK